MNERPRAAIYTLGCRTNQYESDALADLLRAAGFIICDFSEKADVYIVNTCSVTAEADRKSRQFIRRGKLNGDDAAVIAMGCYCQLNPEKAARLGADFVCGSRNKLDAVEYAVKAARGGFPKLVNVPDITGAPMEPLFAESAEITRAFLKIEDGCDNKCAYCIIRRARGNVVSLPPEKIAEEAGKLVLRGYREIVLTGIEIASYGRDTGKYCLSDAVSAVCRSGVSRVRLGSVEPSVLKTGFFEKLAKEPKFCPSFHLSLQSGSDGVLAKMKRKYNSDSVRRSVAEIKKLFPLAGFSADIIVGFPGETEEDFAATCRLAEDLGLFHIHIFPYSDRRGTDAEKMPDKIDAQTKKRRCAELSSLGEKLNRAVCESYIAGKIPLSVLFENRKGEYFYGHAENMLEVKVKTADVLENRIFRCIPSEYDGDAIIALLSEEII